MFIMVRITDTLSCLAVPWEHICTNVFLEHLSCASTLRASLSSKHMSSPTEVNRATNPGLKVIYYLLILLHHDLIFFSKCPKVLH